MVGRYVCLSFGLLGIPTKESINLGIAYLNDFVDNINNGNDDDDQHDDDDDDDIERMADAVTTGTSAG